MTFATKGARLRKVEVLHYQPWEKGRPLVKELKYVGWFHKWLVVDESDGNGRYRRIVAGMIEDKDGFMDLLDPALLRFPEAP